MFFKKLGLVLFLMMFFKFGMGNSIFSFEGMPNVHYGNDVYGLGMGNSGFGDLFRIGTNYQNPAMLSTANKVIFSTAVRFGYNWYLEKEGAGFRDNELHFPYFTFAFPSGKHRFGLQYQPYMNAKLKNEQEKMFTDSGDATYSYNEINRISKAVNKISVIYAYRHAFATLGFSANYFLGHQITYWEMDIENSLYSDAKYETEDSFKNLGFTVGLSKKFETFSLGFSYQSASQLNGDRIKRYNFAPGTDTIIEDDKLFETPPMFSFGYTQKFLRHFKFSSELHYEMWENTDFYEQNSYKIGSGISYDPIRGYGKWYESVPVRLGAFYRLLPFEKENESITETGLTFGFSIPFVAPEKQLDFGCEYILRGDVDAHGVREKILYFSIGINGFDIFSKQPKKTAPRDIPKADF
jgi:hypothetical protein